MHSQRPLGVVQNWSTLQCSKHDIEQCGYDHAPVTRGRMRTQFPLPHGPPPHPTPPHLSDSNQSGGSYVTEDKWEQNPDVWSKQPHLS